MMIFVRWQFPYAFRKWKQGWLWIALELLKENKDCSFEQAKYELIYLEKWIKIQVIFFPFFYQSKYWTTTQYFFPWLEKQNTKWLHFEKTWTQEKQNVGQSPIPLT
jgi:hypothetical protein